MLTDPSHSRGNRDARRNGCPIGNHGGKVFFPFFFVQKTSSGRAVQELSGHKDVATTQLYTHMMHQPGLGMISPLFEG